jgi:ABC-type multidrug transport system fused ATPase/permease subunit
MKKTLKVFKFTFKNFLRFNPYLTVFLALFILATSQIPFLSSKISSDIINKLIDYTNNPAGGLETVALFALAWAGIKSLQSLVSSLKQYLNTVWRYRIQQSLEKVYIEHTISLDSGVMESKDFQNLVQRAFRNGTSPISQVMLYFINIISPIASVLTSSVIILLLDWRIFILSLVSIIPQILIEKKYGKKSWSIWSDGAGVVRRRYYQHRGMITSESSLTEIKRFGAVNFFKDQVYDLSEKTTSELIINERSRYKKYFFVEFLNILSFIGIIFILINNITSGVILIGAFLFYIQTIERFSNSISDLFVGIAYQEENITLVDEIIDYLEIKPLIRTKNPVKLTVKDFSIAPEIVFDNVSFKYPETSKYILRNLSFTIKSGERIGLVGVNGAGKSTIVKLLLRIFDPTSGKITINGIDLKNITPEDWWVHVSALMQLYNVYNSSTVKDSIMVSNYARTDKVDNKKFMESIKKSGADVFIKKWKDKYDSVIGKIYGGESLSTGQMQKMALARTFYKDCSLMILDEPTAAIDAESEIEIFEELEKLPRTISVLYISHDMATIKKADRVILIENGGIAESGNHNELMEKDGHYARIYNAQLNNLTKETA